jgi:hypothetical protein
VTRTLYLVRRRGLRLFGSERVCRPMIFDETLNTPDDKPRTVPVAAFATAEEAAQRARELDRECRRLRNPFWAGNAYRVVTNLGEDDFLARLAALGVAGPPARWWKSGKFDARDWHPWWERNAHDWPEDVFHAVWDLLDRAALRRGRGRTGGGAVVTDAHRAGTSTRRGWYCCSGGRAGAPGTNGMAGMSSTLPPSSFTAARSAFTWACSAVT